MNNPLRQSTAAQSRIIGPFHDDTDFKTAETGLTIANTDIKLLKNGAASVNKNSGGGTHRVNGEYGITFDATDTDTVGELEVSVSVAGALPVWKTFVVVEEAVFDALYVASAPGYVVDQPVNATKIGGTTQTGRDIGASVLLSSGTGTGQLSITSGIAKVDVDTIKTNPVVNAGTVTFPTGATLASTGNITAGTITTVTNLTNAPTNGDFTSTMKAATLARVTLVDTVTTLTNAPPDSAGVTTLLSRIPAALFSGITSLAQWLGLIAGKQTGNSTARTEIRATGAGSGTFDETTDSTEALRDRGDAAWTTGSGGLDAAGVRAAVGLASANLDTQLGDLPNNSELATALASADDAVLAAIAALNNLSQANIRTAIGLATANLDTQLDALPTNSELATALAAADDAVLAAIAALNDLAAGAAMTLTTGERTAIANALLDQTDGVYPGVTPRQAQRLLVASQGAKTDGMGTTTGHIRNPADTKNVVTATIDADGNRSAVTLDLT